jgi:hypothetical protein
MKSEQTGVGTSTDAIVGLLTFGLQRMFVSSDRSDSELVSGSQLTARNRAFERVDILVPDLGLVLKLYALLVLRTNEPNKLTPDTDAAALILGDRITLILHFFLSRNIRITRERVWN